MREPAVTPIRKIGLVLPDLGSHHEIELISSIEEAAFEHNCLIILRRSLGNPIKEKVAVQKMINVGIDGLLILPVQGEYFSSEILRLTARRFPVVFLDRYLKGISAPVITSNSVTAARKATDYLFKLGHTHMGILSSPPLNTTSLEERIEGFVQAHLARGILVDEQSWCVDLASLCTVPLNREEIEQDILTLAEHFKRCSSITAWFAVDSGAALLAKAAAERLGLRVPQDLSVLCFDNPVQQLVSPLDQRFRFTHVEQNVEMLGVLAVETILHMCQYQIIPDSVKLDANLVIGESTGPARSNSSVR